MKYQVRFTNLNTPNHIQRETITAENTDEIVSMMQATNCMAVEIIPQLDEQQAICDAMVDVVNASEPLDTVDLQQASDWQDTPEYKEANKASDNFNFDTVTEVAF